MEKNLYHKPHKIRNPKLFFNEFNPVFSAPELCYTQSPKHDVEKQGFLCINTGVIDGPAKDPQTSAGNDET
jgi:hypothetical protein